MQYICPACLYPYLHEPPRDSLTGAGSYEICFSCGFEFGVTDDDRGFSYEGWRRKWIAEGMPWHAEDISKKPYDWNPKDLDYKNEQ